MRSRVTTASLLATVLALASGCAASAPSTPSVEASKYQRDGLSFSYPSTWKRLNWCWEGTTITPLVVLTTGRTTTACDGQTPWYPSGTVHRRSLSVFWEEGGVPGLRWFETVRHNPTTRVGGQPARTAVITPSTPHWPETACSLMGANLAMVTQVRRTDVRDNYYEMTACLRGPHLAANKAAVRTMLASVHFHVQK
jgi:hypothetical protein